MKSLPFLLLGLLLIGARPAAAQSDSSRSVVPELPRRGLCAHRGAMDTHPENTLAAFREAVRCGAHMIEFDVRLTKDQKLVIMHDAGVDRTTNGKGLVRNLTFKQIRKLDAGAWKSAEFTGEKIPTLQEALAVMPRNIWLNVHLAEEKGLSRRAARLIARQRRLHQAFLACGAKAAKKARAAVRAILICNMDRQKENADYVDNTIRMKANFIQLLGSVTPRFPEHIEKLKQRGIRVNYFGTDSPDELRKLFSMGVNFPLVNRIAASMKVARSLGIQPVAPPASPVRR